MRQKKEKKDVDIKCYVKMAAKLLSSYPLIYLIRRSGGMNRATIIHASAFYIKIGLTL